MFNDNSAKWSQTPIWGVTFDISPAVCYVNSCFYFDLRICRIVFLMYTSVVAERNEYTITSKLALAITIIITIMGFFSFKDPLYFQDIESS